MAQRAIGRAASTYVGLGLLQRSLGLLLLPLVSRVMPPSEFGLVASIVVTASILNVVLAAPFEIGLFRAVVSDRRSLAGLERPSRIYLCYVLPIVGGIAGACVWVVVQGAVGRLWFMELLAASLLAGVSSYGLVVSRAQDKLRSFAVLSLTSSSTLVAGKLLFVVVLQWGPAGWILADLVSAAIAWVVVQGLVARPRTSFEVRPSRTGSTVKAAMALLPHRLSFWTLASVSRPAVAILFSASEAGLYAMAYSLATVVTLVLGELNNAMLVTYARGGETRTWSDSRSAVRTQICAALILPAAGGVALWMVAPILLAESYLPSIGLVAYMLVGQMAYGLYVIPVNFVIHNAGRPGYSSAASVLGALATGAFILVAGMQNSLALAACASSAGFVVMAVAAAVVAVRLGCLPEGFSEVIGFRIALLGIICIVLATTALAGEPGSPVGWLLSTVVLVLSVTSALVERRSVKSQ